MRRLFVASSHQPNYPNEAGGGGDGGGDGDGAAAPDKTNRYLVAVSKLKEQGTTSVNLPRSCLQNLASNIASVSCLHSTFH